MKEDTLHNYYVYILTNKTHTTLYIGVTDNIERRLYEHRSRLNDGFAEKYKTDILVYLEHASDVKDAIAREKQLKGWTRAKKEALIAQGNPDWRELAPEE